MENINELDPKWTSFALGELSESEQAECEKILQTQSELRQEIEEIRKTAAQIEEFMKQEPLPVCCSPLHASANREHSKSSAFRLFRLIAGAAVVLLLLGFVVPGWFGNRGTDLSKKESDTTTSILRPHKAQEELADIPPSASRAKSEIFAERLESASQMGLPVPVSDEKPEALKDVEGELRNVPPGNAIKREKSLELDKKNQSSAPGMGMGGMGGGPGGRTGTMGEMGGGGSMGSTGMSGGKEMEHYATEASLMEFSRRAGGTHDVVHGKPTAVGVRELSEEISKPSRRGRNRSGVGEEPLSLGLPSESRRALSEFLSEESDAEAYSFSDSYDSSGTGRSPEIVENPFLKPQDAPLSTFSIDVDTASYGLMRRMVQSGMRPNPASVRLEEFINSFKYTYEQPEGEKPFATHVEVANCPWEPNHLIAKIGLKGKEIAREDRPALNLVFLIDVSGSMSGSNRLPLVKRGLTELVEMLEERDRVAIVTYAGSSQVVLPSVSGRESRAILDCIEKLNAGGSTAGAAGIQSAYEVARKNFTQQGQNRVILCTDGDFNVGITDNGQLETLIEKEAKSGVFLTVLGFGMGNYRDDKLKILSSKGNGNYGYVDHFDQARKMLVEDLTGTLITIAKDVKIQVDFNPAHVGAYRLLGYEYRLLQARDFHDDRKDAGEIGAGHTITAMYEIVPVGQDIPGEDRVDPSRYAGDSEKETATKNAEEKSGEGEIPFQDELMFVKLRYKMPDADKSELDVFPVKFDPKNAGEMSPDFQFASAAALYAMLLRGSAYSGSGTLASVLELASPGAGGPDEISRKEFLELVRQFQKISNSP